MFCWQCGTKLPSVAAFCYRCGQSQAPGAAFDPDARGIAPDGWSWSSGIAMPSPAPSVAPAPPAAAIPVTIAPDPPAEIAAADASIERAPFHPLIGLLAIGCGLLIVAGSFGPWVTAHIRFSGPFEIRGSDVDGRITAWCGIAAVSCLLLLLVAPQRRGLLTAMATLAFFVAALIGASDWTTVSESLREIRASGWASEIGLLRAEIGWGLRAVTFGGAGGTVLAALQILHGRSRRSRSTPHRGGA